MLLGLLTERRLETAIYRIIVQIPPVSFQIGHPLSHHGQKTGFAVKIAVGCGFYFDATCVECDLKRVDRSTAGVSQFD